MWIGWNSQAYDLTATYVAGRMFARGQAEALYRPVIFGTRWRVQPAWAQVVADAHLPAETVTAYVQTPLWAWLIAPLANAINFNLFRRIFTAFSAIAMVVCVGAAFRQWAPDLASPGWEIATLAGLLVSAPFLWSVSLGQAHAIFLCLAVVAAVRSARGKEVSAGALLAAAAAVKITPIWVAVTWLVAGRWRSALSFAAFSGILAAAALVCAGRALTSDYLATLRLLGARLLLSFNNDAFATILFGAKLSEATAFRFQPVALPGWAAALSLALLACCAVFGGWQDRRSARHAGAVLTLVAATTFAPLAWNHYFIVLVLPLIVFLQEWRGGGRVIWAVLIALIVVLNLPPFAYWVGAPLAIVALRSHLLAALLCMGALPFANLSTNDGDRGNAVLCGTDEKP